MGVLGNKGIDIRQSTARLIFRASLKDSASARVTTGTTTLTIYELQDDGTLKSYDFNDNTFKATALTTATLAMTHRTGNNATTNTGIWTVVLSTLTGFTKGAVYIAIVRNDGALPKQQEREFQFGSVESDFVGALSSGAVADGGTEYPVVDAFHTEFAVAAGVATVKKPDGTTTNYTKDLATDAAAVPIISSS